MGKLPDHIKVHSNDEIPEAIRTQRCALDFGYEEFSVDNIRATFDGKRNTYTDASVTIALPPEKLYQEFVYFTVSKLPGRWHIFQGGEHSLKLFGKENMFSRRFRFDHETLKPSEVVDIVSFLRETIKSPPAGVDVEYGMSGGEKCLSLPISEVVCEDDQITIVLIMSEQSRRVFHLRVVDGGYIFEPQPVIMSTIMH